VTSAGQPRRQPFFPESFPPPGFLRRAWPRLLLVSVLILIPCFWQRHIQAGDLASHLYNARLVQLIHHGQAPGLWLATQWNNVLFDYLLSALAALFGFAAAEKLAVSLAVLVFFWGAFALAIKFSRRVPWFLLPALAMLTYGWTFHSGFFNYYLSLGLSFWGLALFLDATGWKRYSALALTPFILLAHPIGLVWFLGAVLYIALAEKVPGRAQFLLLLLPAATFVFLHFYLPRHFAVDQPLTPRYLSNGADQLALSTDRHIYPAAAAFLFAVFSFLFDAFRRREPGFFARTGLLLQLYLVSQMAVFLLPGLVFFPMYSAPVSLLVERLSLISAVLACCLLATIQPRFWHALGFAGIAAVFFTLTYQETSVLDRMEDRAAGLVRILPPGQRVMETIFSPPDSRIFFVNHIVDRACIGHCFAYGNYEPSSGQFRVRARSGNSIVMTSQDDAGDMEEGNYIVKPQDLPAWQIYQCSQDSTVLCIRSLAVGERNDRLGVHPADDKPDDPDGSE
jgi:hypothetical protein